MIEKKDWEQALKAYENMLINAQVNMIAQETMVKICEDKIKEFPDEDPMPEELKEVVEEVKT